MKKSEKCELCPAVLPDDIQVAIHEGWIPEFWDGDEPAGGPVCPECFAKYLEMKDGGRSDPSQNPELAEELEDEVAKCLQCGAELVTRMVENSANPQDISLAEVQVCPECEE